jgi:hypothetical protein
MKPISVPAVPAAAYNPDRPASDLVKTQIKQLQAAILAAVDTEGEAALCIRVLAKLLRQVRPVLTPRRYGSPHASQRRRASRLGGRKPQGSKRRTRKRS